jgi:hypothetical protein
MNNFKKNIFRTREAEIFLFPLIHYNITASGLGQGFQLYDVTNSVSLVYTNDANAHGDFSYTIGDTYRAIVFAFIDTGFTALATMTIKKTNYITGIVTELFYDSESSILEGTSVSVEFTFIAEENTYYEVTGAAIAGEM